MSNRKIKYLIEIMWLILYSLLLYIATYIIKYDTVEQSIYIAKYLLSVGVIQYLIVPYVIIISIQLIIKSLVDDNWKTNIISTTIIVIISIISYYKFKILGVPFLPSDILLIGNLNQIAEFGITFLPINTVLIIILLYITILLEYLISKKYKKTDVEKKLITIIYRIALFVLGIVILFNLCINPKRFKKLDIISDLGNNYSWMGANAVFFMHLGDFYSVSPEGYNSENIEKIKEETIYNKIENIDINLDKPNVIMIMNEAFSDPNKLKTLKYSINPIHNIERLAQNDRNCKIGNILTPVLGGGTSLPEFEALTGLSSYYIEKQIFPYTSYIRENMNSIVREYKNNGYTTVGIHTNTETFYNRKNVYKYLGFEQTVFQEDINNPEIKGEYISDNELANQIIHKYEENDKNKFIFAVSMQNHMPYESEKYEKYDVEITTNSLTNNEELEIKNYIQGIYDSDQMYIKLVNYLKEVEKPTILVMFGDHLPALNSIYQKNGYKGIDYYITPYIVWTNYDIDYNKTKLKEFISPSNLSINIMNLANLEIPWYLKKFEELYNVYPAINNQYVITDDRKLLNPEQLDSNGGLIEECRILQYDLLIKKKYIPIK